MGKPWPPGGLVALCPAGESALLNPGVPWAALSDRADGAAAALALHARLLQAPSLRAAAQSLVTDLASQAGASRASLALAEPGHTRRLRLLASSGADRVDIASPWRDQVLGAMAEALDQGLGACWPPVAPAISTRSTHTAHITPITAEGADAQAVALHFELQQLQRSVGGAVAVLPLGRSGGCAAAVCIERSGEAPIDTMTLARLEALLQLAGPALDWMQRAERPWHRRAFDALRAAFHRLREPEQRLRRRAVAAAVVALAALALLPLSHDIGGRARLEGSMQRVLAAPTDGFVKTAHVRPGDRVAAGAPLLDLLEDDLRLERDRWASQRAQHENAYASAMARTDRVGAATAMARVAEAQSQLALVEERLGRGRLVAPFDGVVIAGDLSQSIGAPVRQGDTLITLASAAGYRVIVEVDEVDIARVQVGQGGRLSLSALPWQGEDIVVERIAPMARAVEGRNVFEVEARLLAPGPALRPGLLGRAELVVGHRPPLWVWLGRAADRLRLAWWAWLG